MVDATSKRLCNIKTFKVAAGPAGVNAPSQETKEQPEADGYMRLLSYNIHKGVGGSDRRYRIERIIDVLRHEEPDLICLQEVDWNVRRSRYHDQPAILARGLDTSTSLYQLNVPHREGGY